MINQEQIDEITQIVKDKAFARDSHIDFSTRIIGYGRIHTCASEKNARENQHDECALSVDFQIVYMVYSSHSPVLCSSFNEIDAALQCLREL